MFLVAYISRFLVDVWVRLIVLPLLMELKLSKNLQEAIAKSGDGWIPQGETVNKDDVIAWYQRQSDFTSLRDILKLTSVVVVQPPATETKPKSAEYQKLMTQLRKREQEAEYNKLVNPRPQYDTLYQPDPLQAPLPAIAAKQLKEQITTIFNIFVLVASVVYAVWYWTGSSWGLEPVWRVLLCVFTGLLVVTAEVVVYMGYLRRVEEARTKERNKKEVKKVVRKLVVGSPKKEM